MGKTNVFLILSFMIVKFFPRRIKNNFSCIVEKDSHSSVTEDVTKSIFACIVNPFLCVNRDNLISKYFLFLNSIIFKLLKSPSFCTVWNLLCHESFSLDSSWSCRLKSLGGYLRCCKIFREILFHH